MLVPFLLGAILFFAGLFAFEKLDNVMLRKECVALERRADKADIETLLAETAAETAHDGRVQAEQDALSAYSETIELQERAKRLSTHVMNMMRERSQQQSLQLCAPRRFHIEKSPAQKMASRSAHNN